MAKTDEKTEVAEAKSTAVTKAKISFEEDAGSGLEGADSKSFAIPFISLLQGLSPQCEPVKDGGVEGAKPGLFINSITNELFETILVIPAAFKREFLRWGANRGGFKGSFPAVDVDLNKVAGMSHHENLIMMDVPEGQSAFDAKGMPQFDTLADTRNHFVLAQNKAGSWFPALVSLSSTQIKKSKKWLSLIQGVEVMGSNGIPFNPPSYSHIYKLTSVKEENAKGKWQGVQFEIERKLDENSDSDVDLYVRAKKFNKDVVAGNIEVAPPVEDVAGGEAAGDKF